MITTGAKLWFAVTASALAAALVYFLATGGEDGGAVTLLFLAAGATVLGCAAIASRDGDADVAGLEGAREPVVVRTALPAPWPALGALGAGVSAVGYATGGPMLYVGIGILVGTLVEWMVQGWAERSTADPAYNRALRNRIMFPIEIPVIGLLGVVFVILTFSRVLLAVSKNASIVIAALAAALILAVASLVATRPRVSSGAVAWLVAVSAVALLGAGIVGGVVGEREIEPHHAEGEAEGDGHSPEGNAGTDDPSEGTVGDDGSHDDAEEPSE